MNRTTALAILISLIMVGGAFLVMGETQALTPQKGSVTVQISYGSLGIASSSTSFTIKDYSGATVVPSGSGATQTFTLPYGKYYVDVKPLYTHSSKYGPIVANSTVKEFQVNSAVSSVSVTASATKMVSSTVTVNSIATGTTAVLSLETPTGFNFENVTVNSSSSPVNMYLPSGNYFVKLQYQGSSYMNPETSTSSVTVDLPNSQQMSGFVTSSTGSSLSKVTAVVYNPTTMAYSVTNFSNGYYQIQAASFSGDYIYVSSPGYGYDNFTYSNTGTHAVSLSKASSSIYYNYSLSSNLHYLNLSVKYVVGEYTTLPNYFANASVGSLSLQELLDGIDSNSALASNYIQNLPSKYTSNLITVAGDIFNQTKVNKTTITNTASGHFVANVTAEYVNSGIKSSLGTTGYTVKIYAQGTKDTPASLNYHYSFKYANSGLSLSSSSASTSTFTSPVLINPVSSDQWVTLTFGKVSAPNLNPSQLKLYWNGITSSNYVLNDTSANAAYVVPTGKTVNLNASNAYFNPVTGSNDYKYATFTWKNDATSTTYTGYNASIPFTAPSTKMTLSVTSPSGGTNSANFTVYTSSANPTVNYSVSHDSKTQSGTATGSSVNITVPQSSIVSYSAYKSSLGVGPYSAPLNYNWYMPNYTSASPNITYAFDKPYLAKNVGLQKAYLNVSTAFGTYKNVTLLVNVTDTTPPVAKMVLTNQTNSKVPQPTAGVPTTFSANSSTDPYYHSSQLTYNWAVKYANGTTVKNGSSTYNVVSGSMSGSYVVLKFNTLDHLIVSLKATNPSGVAGYSNMTLNMVVNSPRLVVNSIYMKGNLTQGSQSTIYINVSNNGTVAAHSFTLAIYINNKQVSSHFYNESLAVGQARNVSYNYTPGTSGSTKLVFQANNTSQPAFMSSLGSYTTSVSINAPAYKTPLIIGAIIAVIVIVGVVYYRLNSGKGRKPKQQPKPKTELKKQQEKKK